MNSSIDLSVEINGLRFKNPVLTALGTFGYGVEFNDFFDISELGGFCTKGLSLHPMAGNAPGRIVETPAGMLNAIGLENVGVEAFIAEKLPQLETVDCHVIANILGKSVAEFVEIVERLNPFPKISAYELNISCPNIKEGGVQFGHDPVMAAEVVKAVAQSSEKPVWVKLSPNVTDISVFARACEEAGADALTLVNTFVGMAIDIKKRRPMLSNVTGGLSGPAIKPLALRMVYQAARAVEIPVVGIGGITTAQDALEFMIAGAQAVQIGTANFVDPLAGQKLVEGLRAYCEEQGLDSIRSIIGSLVELQPGDFLYY
ncbi:MAG: dihydroorotate dehydrogenase [Acidobacteriota bacterium]|nr:MAG: dihydroorotate dehydrogenase [Acidobacteriota bacterium]